MSSSSEARRPHLQSKSGVGTDHVFDQMQSHLLNTTATIHALSHVVQVLNTNKVQGQLIQTQ